MNKIKISVILPVYNVAPYIGKCILALKAQTLTDLEFIFVDDCSDDDSAAIIEEFAREDDRVRLLKNAENLGPGVSRNAGIESAKGDYLSFVDPDDWLEKNYFAHYMAVCDTAGLVIGGSTLFYEEHPSRQIEKKYPRQNISGESEARRQYISLLTKAGIVKKVYTNQFLQTRISNFFFDVMVVAGMAAIRLQVLARYWVVLLIMGVVGMVITYIYNRLIVKVLFKEYPEEQFLMEYGMMTGTASTATILLRELDPDFKAPAAENMVYQNFPAIVFGFPMMLLATLAPVQPLLCLMIFIGFFAVMNVILFRRQIFLRKKK